MMRDDEAEGRALLAKIRGEVGERLKAEGFHQVGDEWRADFINVEVRFAWGFSRHDYDQIKLTVTPPYDIRKRHRKVSYRVNVPKATPETVAAQIEKLVSKAREVKAAVRSQAQAEEASGRLKRARREAVRKALAAHLPEFKDSGDGSLYIGPDDVNAVPVVGDGVRVYLRLSRAFTPQEARAVVDFVKGLRADAGRGNSDVT